MDAKVDDIYTLRRGGSSTVGHAVCQADASAILGEIVTATMRNLRQELPQKGKPCHKVAKSKYRVQLPPSKLPPETLVQKHVPGGAAFFHVFFCSFLRLFCSEPSCRSFQGWHRSGSGGGKQQQRRPRQQQQQTQGPGATGNKDPRC